MKEEGKVSWDEPEPLEPIIVWAESNNKMPTEYAVCLWALILFIVFGVPALFYFWGK